MIIAAFDPATVNLAFFIREFSSSDFESFKQQKTKFDQLSETDKKIKNNSTSLNEIIDLISSSGKRIDFGTFNISDKENDSKIQKKKNLFKLFESKFSVFSTINHLLIEEQFIAAKTSHSNMNFNLQSRMISDAICDWFLIRLPNVTIEFYPSRNKTDLLSSEKFEKKSDRKKWSSDKFIKNWSELRKDSEFQLMISSSEKLKRKRLTDEKKQKEISLFNSQVSSEDIRLFFSNIIFNKQKFDDVADCDNMIISWILKNHIK